MNNAQIINDLIMKCAEYKKDAEYLAGERDYWKQQAQRNMSCEYCDGSKKPIHGETDEEGYIEVFDPDPEYNASEFALDIRAADGALMYEFFVPCCPMCGRRLK